MFNCSYKHHWHGSTVLNLSKLSSSAGSVEQDPNGEGGLTCFRVGVKVFFDLDPAKRHIPNHRLQHTNFAQKRRTARSLDLSYVAV